MNLYILGLVLLITPSSALVRTLDHANFDHIVGHKQGVFVKMYAPWCGHCKAMQPAWNMLGDMFDTSTQTIIAETDCTRDLNEGLCNKMGVTGYPTILAFKAGSTQPSTYKGRRLYDDLKKFVDKGGV